MASISPSGVVRISKSMDPAVIHTCFKLCTTSVLATQEMHRTLAMAACLSVISERSCVAVEEIA